ncbi:hypothetical protein QCE73_36980 [Caballeronia sp. LZ029]|uniref:hypothetical protein n=1 Tax=Caballeronia sp. LZ029 TaxID=3038564 RepID=UPI0028670345|nr:hypothetical protein [Caballeronia sp. LZ029]MDR5748779.1 hypothetical protein [Caballeronia sp. LZ029]
MSSDKRRRKRATTSSMQTSCRGERVLIDDLYFHSLAQPGREPDGLFLILRECDELVARPFGVRQRDAPDATAFFADNDAWEGLLIFYGHRAPSKAPNAVAMFDGSASNLA